jgi:DNA-binding beta-propeller fold protein YncE
MKRIALAAVFSTLATLAAPAAAQLAVSANDNKQVNIAGVGSVVPNAAPDTVTVIDLGVFPPKVVGELQVPTSLVGPPSSVAVAPDESFALVSSAMKKDPADAAKVIDDNRLSVIDLKTMKVVQTVEAGLGAAGVAINPQASLALVANRNEGTVSVFTIKGTTLTPAGKITLGKADSGPSAVKFIGDGKRALVTRDGDSTITMLAVDGAKVTATSRNIFAGIRPYGADVTPDGRYAVVANVGRGQGDADTASLIDLSMNPPRVVDTISVGPTPEGIKISPNGKYAAVVVHNGSAFMPTSPFYNAFGKVVLLGISGGKLTKLSEERTGRWSQGSAFSNDSSTLLVQNMVEKDIQVYKIELDQLRDTWHRIKLSGGGAAMGTAR